MDCGKLIGGRREWDAKAVVNALEPELIEEAYRVILGSEAGGPVGGPQYTRRAGEKDKAEGPVRRDHENEEAEEAHQGSRHQRRRHRRAAR